MKFTIMTASHEKLSWVRTGIETYIKRIRPMAKIEIVNLAVSKSKGSFAVLQKEDEKRILANIPKQSFVYLCDADGEMYTSESFAKKIESTFHQKPHIVFVIGPAYGLSDQLLSQYPVLSLSKMTLQHEMALLLLVEQLYRSLAILNHHPYHL